MKPGAVKKIDAHAFEQQAEEHYVEEAWCNRVLFDEEVFIGTIHDPCCGFGRIPLAARAAGHKGVTGSDLVGRGFPGAGVFDFLGEFERPDGLIEQVDNIVMNPPFTLGEKFITCGLRVARRKVAAILPVRRLNAAWKWMAPLPLVQIWYLTPRPSMPPGHVAAELEAAGKRPKGGKQDFCWVVFDHAYAGCKPQVGWLHRDRGAIR